jgi:hypothetical protein
VGSSMLNTNFTTLPLCADVLKLYCRPKEGGDMIFRTSSVLLVIRNVSSSH